MESVKSSCEKYCFRNLEQLKKDIQEYEYVLMYNIDQVEFLKVKDVSDFQENKLTEIRAFDEDKELHVIKVNNADWRGRIRRDKSGGDSIEYIDEFQLIWGSNKRDRNGYSLMREDRGVEIEIPIRVKSNEKAFIVVRNYLSDKVFEFCDFRLVRICAKGVKKYEI